MKSNQYKFQDNIHQFRIKTIWMLHWDDVHLFKNEALNKTTLSEYPFIVLSNQVSDLNAIQIHNINATWHVLKVGLD